MTLKALVAAQPMYSGTWIASNTPQVFKLRRPFNEFISDYGTQWSADYRLTALTAHVIGTDVFYGGVWSPNTDGQSLGLARTHDQFIEEYGKWWSKGFRLAALATYVVDSTIYYSGVYDPSAAGQFVGLARTYDQFIADYKMWWSKGYRLGMLTSEVVDGQARYSGVWNPGTSGQYLRLGRTHEAFLDEYQTRWSEGFRLSALCTHLQDGVVRYGGVWNPGTAGQYLNLALPEPDLARTNEQRAAQGWRLDTLVIDCVEALDIGLMGQRLSDAYAGKCVGYAATIATSGVRVPAVGGLRRTASDPPSSASSTTAPLNVASVAKSITAVAVLKLLGSKRRSVNSKIAPYLPGDWTKGPNIETITFKELLTHRSGIRNDQPETYENLRKLIANGIDIANKTKNCEGNPGFCYQNANYSLFRIIIPYLNGYTTPATNPATAVSAAYMSYMNQKIFAPAGIPSVTLKPVSSEPTLCYPFPSGNVKGIHFGDWTDQAGGAGYQLSSDELVAFLMKLRDGTLLSTYRRNLMDTQLLGWQARDDVRHGSAYRHGGGFPLQPGALNTLLVSFTSGVQVGVEVNSAMSVGIYKPVVDAYNGSWIPIR